MTATLAQIWRHPIKGIGAEELQSVAISAGLPLPFDRAWAVLQEGGEDQAGWRSCRNFLRGAKGASLMAIRSETLSDAPARFRLSHPERPDIEIDPASDSQALIDWVMPIYPENRPAAAKLVEAPAEGMADVPFASISVLNLASLRALGQKLGQDLDPRRFRGNFWVEGWAPWEEFDLVGKALAIGDARFEVVEPITRCRATEANPETGRSDARTLDALQAGWGHRDFGVYAKATVSAEVAVGQTVAVV